IIRVVVGALLVLYPNAGAQSLTLVLSVYFIVSGLFRAIGSALLQFPSWGWAVGAGSVAIALGMVGAGDGPGAGAGSSGVAAGIDLILYGWALLMFAAAVKNLTTALG